jgi:hypothetical protein
LLKIVDCGNTADFLTTIPGFYPEFDEMKSRTAVKMIQIADFPGTDLTATVTSGQPLKFTFRIR